MSSPPELALTAPFAGVVVDIAQPSDRQVRAGAVLVVLEAMKMEHEVLAEADGVVSRVEVAVGDAVGQGDVLLVMVGAVRNGAGGVEDRASVGDDAPVPAAGDVRADVKAVCERHALGLDTARPEAVEKRRERGRRTARENLADLVDEGTFVEYGPLIFAAQERRRTREELIAATPADGLVGGAGEIEGNPCVAMSYDYTVLAGTQ
ncbi:MAG TPA: biotin/lipoyl-containing protein, partial [Solirubrobacteraceae bacterium]